MAKVRRSKTRDEATVVKSMELTYYCAYLEKEFTTIFDEHSMCTDTSGCDCCGTATEVTVDVSCECGHIHDLIMKNGW